MAAAAAPDHEQLLPWRFVEIPRARRADLGAAFAAGQVDKRYDRLRQPKEVRHA